MRMVTKSWLWWFTWPFAHNNWTNLFGVLYCPKGRWTGQSIIRHEEIHTEQAAKYGGWLVYYFLYLFCLPFIWNPFRRKMETEAYRDANGWTQYMIDKQLRSAMYGWLLL